MASVPDVDFRDQKSQWGRTWKVFEGRDIGERKQKEGACNAFGLYLKCIQSKTNPIFKKKKKYRWIPNSPVLPEIIPTLASSST